LNLLTVIAPVFASVASPDSATPVATFDPLPTNKSPDGNALASNVPDVGSVTAVFPVVVIARVFAPTVENAPASEIETPPIFPTVAA
jgi:hypothetical protein